MLSILHSYTEVPYDNYPHNKIGHGVLCNERWLGECALNVVGGFGFINHRNAHNVQPGVHLISQR